MKNSKYLMLLFIFIFSMACDQESSDIENKKKIKTPSPTALKISQKEFIIDSGNCQDQACAKIEFRYPFIEEGPEPAKKIINDFINEDLIRSIYSFEEGSPSDLNLEEAGERFMKGYRSLKNESPDATAMWEVGTNGEIILQNANFITLRLQNHSYTGGAHPNYYINVTTFDLNNGKQLGWQDMITDTSAIKLLGKAKFKETRSSDGEEFLWEDYFGGEEYLLPENFGLTKQGLYFSYNYYEAAPYAAGPTEYTIPFEALKNIIDPKMLEKMMK